jgi:peroxiredoxin
MEGPWKTFPVLSDPDLAAHRAYRVLQEVDDATLTKYKEWGIDLEKSSGRSHHTIAVPSMFLIGKTGVIRWAPMLTATTRFVPRSNSF